MCAKFLLVGICIPPTPLVLTPRLGKITTQLSFVSIVGEGEVNGGARGEEATPYIGVVFFFFFFFCSLYAHSLALVLQHSVFYILHNLNKRATNF